MMPSPASDQRADKAFRPLETSLPPQPDAATSVPFPRPAAPQQLPLPNFDPVARIYRFAEYLALGPLLQRTRTHFLADLPPLSQALLLGDGDGRFLSRLLAHQPQLQAVAVDTSATMLHLLRRGCHSHASRVQTLRTSALTVIPPPGTDLVVTHFFLDCLTQPELNTLTHHLAAHIAPGTLWLLSDFAIPQGPVLGSLAALYIRFLYFAFRILTGLRVTRLPDPQTALTAAGFTRLARHELLGGVLYTEIWQLH